MTDISTTDRQHSRVGRLLLAIAVVVVFVATSAGAGVGTAAAQDNNTTNVSEVAPYYENQTRTPAVDSWTSGARDPSLANLTNYLARIPGFVLGDGGDAQGGGSATGLVFGLLLLGGLVGVASGTTLGGVGGSVLGVIGVAGFATAGLLPWWLYVVLLFVVGGVAAAVGIRIWR